MGDGHEKQSQPNEFGLFFDAVVFEENGINGLLKLHSESIDQPGNKSKTVESLVSIYKHCQAIVENCLDTTNTNDLVSFLHELTNNEGCLNACLAILDIEHGASRLKRSEYRSTFLASLDKLKESREPILGKHLQSLPELAGKIAISRHFLDSHENNVHRLQMYLLYGLFQYREDTVIKPGEVSNSLSKADALDKLSHLLKAVCATPMPDNYPDELKHFSWDLSECAPGYVNPHYIEFESEQERLKYIADFLQELFDRIYVVLTQLDSDARDMTIYALYFHLCDKIDAYTKFTKSGFPISVQHRRDQLDKLLSDTEST